MLSHTALKTEMQYIHAHTSVKVIMDETKCVSVFICGEYSSILSFPYLLLWRAAPASCCTGVLCEFQKGDCFYGGR